MVMCRIFRLSKWIVLALLLMSPVALGSGCSDGEATQLIVVVDTDLNLPTAIDGVDFSAVGAGGMRVTAHSSLASSAALPLTLALEPSGAGGAVDIRVTGTLAGVDIVEQRVTTSFVQGERRLVQIYLSNGCVGVTCSDAAETCRSATCVGAAVPTSALPHFDGEPGRLDGGALDMDAGTDSGVDAAICDCAPGVACVDGVCEDDLAVSVNCGNRYTCITRRSGVVSCLGENISGQLGNGSTSTEPQLMPTDVVGFGAGVGDSVTAMSAGYDFACVLTARGEVFCWGANEAGELGDGTLSTRSTPQRVSRATAIQALSCGVDHTCVVDAAGQVSCFGNNVRGQLGDGTLMTRNTVAPVIMSADGTTLDAVGVSAGARFTCATGRDGGVSCWGSGLSGENGDSAFMDRLAPSPVMGLDGLTISSTTTGLDNGCALSDSGLVHCWGAADFGRLGDNGASGGGNQASAVPLPSLTNVTQIAAGPNAFHTCALTSDGPLFCWGGNGKGQIGNDEPDVFAPLPVMVALPSGVIAMDTGGAHTCAVLDTGRVYCWGLNTSGQLGDGTLDQRNIPTVATAFF